MSFSARYDGWCASDDCHYTDNRITAGDSVQYLDDELMHEECAKRSLRRQPPLCAACNQYHRGECY